MLIISADAERIWCFSCACCKMQIFENVVLFRFLHLDRETDGKKCEKSCMKFKKLSTFPHVLCTTKISYELQKFIFNNIFLSLILCLF